MTDLVKKGIKSEADILRQKAEDLLKNKSLKTNSQISETEALKLIHELEVHQIELELQNEELKLAKERIGIEVEKYVELYDFAPSGYFTLSEGGQIIELNLHGSQMLGHFRNDLINHPFSYFMSESTKPAFNFFLKKIFIGKAIETCEITVSSENDLPVYLHLSGIADKNGEKCYISAVDITRIKQAEEALHASEDKYRIDFLHQRSILESPISIITFALDKNYCYTSYTETHKETIRIIWGADIRVGTNMLEIISNPEDRQKAKANFDRALQGEYFILTEEYGDQALYRTYYEDYYNPLRDSDDNISGVSVFVIDITLRMRAEKALQQSEEKFRNLFNNSAVGMFRTRIDGSEMMDLNDRFLSILKYTREELVGNPSVNLWADKLERDEMLQLLQDENNVIDFECGMLTKQGEVRRCLTSLRLYRDTGILEGSIQDITERKLAEASINQLASIVQSSEDAIIGKNLDGIITSWNKGAENIYGYNATEMIGKSVILLTPKGNKDEIPEILDKIKSGGIIQHYETSRLRKDGREIHVSLSISPIRDTYGKIIAASTIARDISERKLTENALNESRKELISTITQLANAQHTGHIGSWNLNLKTQKISGSAEARRLFGLQDSENSFDLQNIEACIIDRERVHQALIDLITNDTLYDLEYIIHPADGSKPRVIISKATTEKDSAGNPVSVNGIIQDITERKMAEEKLLSQTSLLDAQLNSTIDGVLVVNQDQKRILTNRRMIELFNVPPEIEEDDDDTLLLKHVTELTKNPDQFLEKVKYLYDHVNEESFDEVELKTGMVIDRYSAPVIGIDGKNYGRIWVFRDITHRKKAEYYQEQQLLFTTALKEISEVIIINEDAEKILENTNRIMGETLRLDRSLIYYVSFKKNRIFGLCEWLRQGHPDIVETKAEYPLNMFLVPFTEIWETKRFLESHKDNVGEYFTKDESGKLLHDHFKIKSLIWYPFAFDKHSYYVFTLNQIQEQRHWTEAEIDFLASAAKQLSIALIKIRLLEERKQSENELRKLSRAVEQSPASIVITNLRGDIEYVNPKFSAITGYSFEEALGKNPRILKSDETKSESYKALWETITSGKEWRGEFRNKKKNGELFWERASISPVLNEIGEITHFIAIKEDIGKEKNLISNLMIAKEKAEESDRLKSAFLANMSHEIRTPMNGILGFAELLKEPNVSVEDQEKYLGVIQKSGNRLLNIINDIVDISKIESGQMETTLSEVNVNEKIEDIYNFFMPQAQQKGIHFSNKCSLPADQARISSDKVKIYAILTNLVYNAFKFTYAGSIEFGYEKKESFLEFFVKDTGIGISEANKDIIFKRFMQGGKITNKTYEGTGLGLSISKSYVEMLGGKIWVESEEGQGSTFYFTIPYITETLIKSSIPDGFPLADKAVQMKNLKILIVEDDATSDFFITSILNKNSHELLHAQTGNETIEVCRNNTDLDLILMDINLPEMSGYEATQKIRQFNKSVIIIAQTAYALAGDREAALSAGCNDYISKPIDKDQLKALIQKYFKA